jgi:hypothetical protein
MKVLLNMSNLRRRAPARNTSSAQFDLFSWRPTIHDAAPFAVRKLAARFGMSIAHATTVAALAGIGPEVQR